MKRSRRPFALQLLCLEDRLNPAALLPDLSPDAANLSGWTVSTSGGVTQLYYATAMQNLGNGAFSPSQIPGYDVGDLSLTYDATPRVQLFARVDNLSDQRYEPTSGYAAASRSGFVGVRARY